MSAERQAIETQYKRSKVGFPIRRSLDQSSFAAPQGLSQRTTSFIASQRQGIHRMLLRHLIASVIDVRFFATGPPRIRRQNSDTVTKRPATRPFPGTPPYACRTRPPGFTALAAPTATFPLHDVLRTLHATRDPGSEILKARATAANRYPDNGSTPFQRPSPLTQRRVPKTGGARRDRTDDLMLAKQPLSQLSYGPKRQAADAEQHPMSWWAWDDSNVRPHPYQGCALTT